MVKIYGKEVALLLERLYAFYDLKRGECKFETKD